MRIAIVTDQEFPGDIRVEKESGTLARAGHEVFVCTPMRRLTSIHRNDYRVLEIGEPLSMISALGGNLHRLVATLKPEVLHVQDTPAVLAGLIAAKRQRLPLIFDVHEPWPALVIDNAINLSYRERLWSKELLVRESLGFMKADFVITIVEELSQYYQKSYRLSSNRIWTIRNFESLDSFRSINPSEDIIKDESFKVAYVGGLDGKLRGLEEVLHSAKLLSEEKVRFLIVGNGVLMPHLQRLSRRLGVEDVVHFYGHLRFDDAMRIAAAADLCLVPHRHCFTNDHGLPHKISQYMCLRKPVVSPDLAPIKRLFGSSYLSWEPQTPGSLARLIRQVKDDEKLLRRMGLKGYSMIRDHYSWEGEEEKLLAVYEQAGRR